MAAPAWSGNIKNGEDLIAAMRKKYEAKWYKTLTFAQQTITHKPDGTSSTEIWHEALSMPGKLRIDIAPLEKNNGILFADEKLHSIRDGKVADSRPFTHPLLVLGFDVYHQPAEKTISQLKGMKIDTSVLHETVWQGRKVYVVGARAGDLKTPQFWVDKKNLYFVRMVDLVGKDRAIVSEIQFNKYFKVKGGGWVSPEVLFFTDGKLAITEIYTDLQANVALDPALFDPQKWTSVDRSYFKKR